jgi:hypothetical protein
MALVSFKFIDSHLLTFIQHRAAPHPLVHGVECRNPFNQLQSLLGAP